MTTMDCLPSLQSDLAEVLSASTESPIAAPKPTKSVKFELIEQSAEAQPNVSKPIKKSLPSSHSARPRPAAPKRTKKPRRPVESLGYVVTTTQLCLYAEKHNLCPLFNIRSGDLFAIRHISKQIPGGILCHWVVGPNQPFLAVATNTHPKLLAMNTPERVQALKAVLEREEDPEWTRCKPIF